MSAPRKKAAAKPKATPEQPPTTSGEPQDRQEWAEVTPSRTDEDNARWVSVTPSATGGQLFAPVAGFPTDEQQWSAPAVPADQTVEAVVDPDPEPISPQVDR